MALQTRTCPKCGIEITYKNGRAFKKACSLTTLCKRCTSWRENGIEPRVGDVTALHSEGLTDAEIAQRLGIPKSQAFSARSLAGLPAIYKRSIPPLKIKLVGDSEAECSRCGIVYELSYFPKDAHNGRHYSFCKSCHHEKQVERLNFSLAAYMGSLLSGVRDRSRRFGIPCDFDREHLVSLFYAQNGTCFYTDEPMRAKRGKGHANNSVSIDRVDPTKGYTKDNVVLCTYRVNSAKRDFSVDEMRLWMPIWYERAYSFLKNGLIK